MGEVTKRQKVQVRVVGCLMRWNFFFFFLIEKFDLGNFSVESCQGGKGGSEIDPVAGKPTVSCLQ